MFLHKDMDRTQNDQTEATSPAASSPARLFHMP